MRESFQRIPWLHWLVLLLVLMSCSLPTPTPTVESLPATPKPVSRPSETPTIEQTPVPPRLLTVCLGQEPASLFLYADTSAAARSVRQAIYDGPVDLRGYTLQPVILERIPETSNGDALLQPVQVISNTLVATSQGTLANLAEGVSYQPSGCYQAGCAQTYTGTAPASLDQLVVRFRIRPGLLWSDGTPLTASDSVFAFETAKALYPRLRPELIDFTASYQALDEVTVEWRGVPGYKDPLYQTDFFVPMPRHLWGKILPLDLFSDEAVNRTPIGWGPYIIDEWKAGDHITLHKNPNYFRHGEGLPAFDNLVYRFVGDGEAALSALLAGECDVLDESALNNVPHQRLLDLQTEGKLKLSVEPGMAWEHADFDLAPIDPARLNLFQSKDLRQAIALCIDRGALVKALFFGKPVTLNTFVPPSHPLYNPQARTYDYNPQQAQSMLTAAGWIDTDGNPQTARVAQGILKIPDGTPLAFTYQTLGGGERQQAAQMIRDELAQCGIQLNLEFGEREALFAPGPDGPVFGRNYDMAQFAWPTAMQPTCSLYTTDEIPGPYPQFPKGWGGANNTGYSNPAYDQACRQARSSLPDSPVYAEAQRQAQATFAEDLPAIPLYVHLTWIAMRPDLCGVDLQTPVENTFWNLEKWDYGEKVTCDS